MHTGWSSVPAYWKGVECSVRETADHRVFLYLVVELYQVGRVGKECAVSTVVLGAVRRTGEVVEAHHITVSH